MSDRDDRHAWERPGTFEVAPGVHRIPLPLPGDGLKAVNVYAIVQPDGVVLVDSGWGTADAEQQLADGLAALELELGDVRRILCTHVHRDHLEQSMVLRRRFGSEVLLGADEQTSMERLVRGGEDEISPLILRMEVCGAPTLAEVFRGWVANRVDDRPHYELPDTWVHHHQRVELADRTLVAHATPGHTHGHVVFVDEAAGLLLSGDHVLPHITPSIGFESVLVASPLGDYLTSLALVRGMPDHRMLPAHGPVRETTHDRVDELLAHHEVRLADTLTAARGGAATAHEVAARLGWTRRATPFDELDPFNQMLAVNETGAHLDVLVERDELARTEVDGVHTYAT